MDYSGLQIQGMNYSQQQLSNRNQPHFQKQVNASGGFKVPKEVIEKRKLRNQYQCPQNPRYIPENIEGDLPTRDEIFSGLGIDLRSQNSEEQGNSGFQATMIQAEKQRDLLRLNRQLISEKQSQLYQESKVQVDISQFKPHLRANIVQDSINHDYDDLIEQHRSKMKPIEDSYFQQLQPEQRKPSDGQNYMPPKNASRSNSNPRKQLSSKSLTPQVKPNVEKMRRTYNDFNEGSKGEFLQNVMPPRRVEQVRSMSARIKDDDHQRKFRDYMFNKRRNHNRSALSHHSDDDQLEFELYQSTSPNPSRHNAKHRNKAIFRGRQFGSSGSPSRSNSRKKGRISMSPNDEEIFLIKHFFNEMDNRNQKKVDKIQVIKYLVSNPQILDAFDIEPVNINRMVNQFKTKDNSSFNLAEFTTMLQKQKKQAHKGHEVFGQFGKISGVQHHATACLLKPDQINQIKSVFDRIENDGTALRISFIQELRNDINVVRLLNVQACYVASIDKIQTLETVLSLVEHSYFASEDKEAIQYISWQQFMEFLNTDGGQIDKSKLAYAQLQSQVEDNIDDQDHMDAPKEVIDVIYQQYDLLDKHEEEFISTFEFTDAIRRHPVYSRYRRVMIRQKAKKFKLKEETLEQILQRIEEEAQEFLSLPEFLSYFTRRGHPKFGATTENEMLEQLAQSINVTDHFHKGRGKGRNGSPIDTDIIDGYDSDPEIHTYQEKMIPRQRFARNHSAQAHLTYSHRSSLKQIKRDNSITLSHSKQEFLAAIMPSNKHGAQSRPGEFNFKITRPEPYNFDGRDKGRSLSIRAKKLKEMMEQKEIEERAHLEQRFRAKEIPKHVKEPLFEQITQANEERRAQVKKNSVAMTRQNERPFSFYLRDKNKDQNEYSQKRVKRKKYWEREQFVFKAKAIPWHVKVDLWRQMMDIGDNTRKERVAKHAQQLAMSSKMPPRMEQYERKRQAMEIELEYNSNKFYKHTHQPNITKGMPDFNKLHSVFQESLDRKKQQMRTTEPKPFNFTNTHKGPQRDYMDIENAMMKQTNTVAAVDPVTQAKKAMSRKPVRQPASTKKWEANLQKLRKDKEEKREKEKQIELEDRQRIEKQEKFKTRVHGSKAIQDNSQKLKAQREKRVDDFKKNQKEQARKFKEWKQERIRNAENQPLLVERPTKRDLKLEMMKKLKKFNQILEQNKVTNKEDYLNEEEKKLMKDMEYLEKQGYGDDFEEDDGEN